MNIEMMAKGTEILFGLSVLIGSLLMFLVMFLAASYADQTGDNFGLLLIGLLGQIGFVILGWESIKYIL